MPHEDHFEEEFSAAAFVPEERTLPALREAAQKCRGCPLWKSATQTVFGEGLPTARLVLVGEQPGDVEDRQGRPFVGPAGRVLDKALETAGIDRNDAYVTNAVKHFKWVQKGRLRLHKKPNAREIGACMPWLEAEIDLIRPEVVVAMGATAAQALFGEKVRVMEDRGRFVPSNFAPYATVTVHPSSILRVPSEEDRHKALSDFSKDLRAVAQVLKAAGQGRR
ncbi:MAG: Uracil DNA glycosylase superfamily protein [Syntrophorhabdaceae bacterium PtaU1.Bin034]|nr:MAG: Uracil DNA glycosylase superfamily protein [Syntrophorhabdaceae bacterium PtaU1.Bin034]